MGIRSVTLAAAGVLFYTCASLPALAQATPEAGGTARLIIKLRATAGAQALATNQRTPQIVSQNGPDRARRLAERSGLSLRGTRDLGNRMVGLALRSRLAGDTLEATLAALRSDPDIEFAEVDQRRYARAFPSDPLYTGQWYQQSVETAATNFEAAWDTTSGAADTVVAVLDSGIRFEHPDLTGRILPGYDFVSGESSSSFVSANDGNDWDADASDPGDWVSNSESASGPLAGCRVDRSSWHGTRVASMIGAATNNGEGLAGSTWLGDVLPVRVLGKCGGYDSDIIAGMRWAAGLPLANAPANPTPARILNLSLGGPGACAAAYVDVLTELTAAGVLVVISAGNPLDSVAQPVETPANCPGALAVAGLRHIGTKNGFSSFGPEVGIAAPGGNCPSTPLLCEYFLVAATNAGTTVPATSTYTADTDVDPNIGTSFSAPIVSAIAGLMLSVNDQLTTAEMITRIKAGARPFPVPEPGLPTCPELGPGSQCNCTTSTCGAGIADAPGAISEALRPMARIVTPAGSAAGQNVILNGNTSGTARNRTVASYAWTGVSGNPAFVGATNGPNVTVAVPGTGLVGVRLTVTDDLGRTDSSEVTLGVVAGGGGGGAIHPLVLLVLGMLLGRRRNYR